MLIKFRNQGALAVFYRATDDGRFVAVCCAKGLQQLLGRKLKIGEEVLVDMTVTEIVDGKSA